MEISEKTLICGYSKSGTTIIAKTFAFCCNKRFQNELKQLWGISKYANVNFAPDDSIAERVKNSEQWKEAIRIFNENEIIKFPEGILILNILPSEIKVICVIRNPLDTICSYLERKYEFKKIIFSRNDLEKTVKDWNYHISSLNLFKGELLCVKYEDFIHDQKMIIEQMANFAKYNLINEVPCWINEQAQKYYNFVSAGQPIRGVNRYKVSLNNKEIIDQLLNICQPALIFLKNYNIVYKY